MPIIILAFQVRVRIWVRVRVRVGVSDTCRKRAMEALTGLNRWYTALNVMHDTALNKNQKVGQNGNSTSGLVGAVALFWKRVSKANTLCLKRVEKDRKASITVF